MNAPNDASLPKINCPQRLGSDATGRTPTAPEVMAISILFAVRCDFAHASLVYSICDRCIDFGPVALRDH